MEQVGTVYTAQGFEFDYIGVIFGNDLVYDPSRKQWQSVLRNSHDTQVKRNNPDLARHLQNVYCVLMSRVHGWRVCALYGQRNRTAFQKCYASIGRL